MENFKNIMETELCKICQNIPQISFEVKGSCFGSANLQLKDVMETCIPELKYCTKYIDTICQNCASCMYLFYQFRIDVLKNQKKTYNLENVENLSETKQILNNSSQLSENKDFLYDDDDDDDEDLLQSINSYPDFIESEILSDNDVVKNEHNYTLINKRSVKNETESVADVIVEKSEKSKKFKDLERNFACDLCPYRTVCKSQLEIHVRIHTGEKPYLCEYCPYKAKRKAHLQDHLRTHTGERPYVCDTCGKCFPTKSMLSAHLDAHSTEKNYCCKKCDFRTNNRASLYGHMKRKHSDKPKVVEKKFICNICNKRFIAKQTLRVHLRLHTGKGKKYMCEKCGRCYRDSTMLKNHTLLHSKEKPYSCTNCDYRANRKSHLAEHLKTHIESVALVGCYMCNKQFTTKRLVINHMQEEHNQNIKEENNFHDPVNLNTF